MKDFNDKLFKTLEYRGKTATDSKFLKNLSKCIFDKYGNVNVAMRLNNLSEKLK